MVFDEKKHVVRMSTSRGDIVVQTDDLREVLEIMTQAVPVRPGEDEIQRRAQALAQQWVAQYQQQMAAQQQAYQQRSQAAGGQAQQAGPGPQGIPPQMPGSFIDVTPDKMTKELWASLTREQQQQYADRYMR